MSNGEGRECDLRYHWRVRQGPDNIGHVAVVTVCFFFFLPKNTRKTSSFRTLVILIVQSQGKRGWCQVQAGDSEGEEWWS